MQSAKYIALSVLVVLPLLLEAPRAVAQEQEEPQARERPAVEEVVVTARRREESLQETPLAITAFGGTTMEELGVQDFYDLHSFVPGLYAQTIAGHGSGAAFQIRGVNASGGQLNTDPSVGMYINGMYQPRAIDNLLNLFDVDRVEVLKGPQGTLFGRNTTGGAIQLLTKKPNDKFGGYISLIYGDYTRHDVSGAMDVPITEELAARFAFQVTRRDEGYGTNLTDGQDLSDDHTDAFRLSLQWQPLQNVEVFLTADKYKARENSPLFHLESYSPTGFSAFLFKPQLDRALALANDPFENLLTPCSTVLNPEACQDNTQDIDSRGATGEITVDFEKFSVKTLLSWRSDEIHNSFDLDGTEALILHPDQDMDPHRSSSAELQFYGNAYDRLDWITGAYWFSEEGNDGTTTCFFGSPRCSTNLGSMTNTAYSFFVHGSYDVPWLEGLRFSAGGRWNNDRREITFKNYAETRIGTGMPVIECTMSANDTQVTQGGPVLDPCKENSSQRYAHFTWNLGLDYRFNDDEMVYIAHRHGYRTGGFNHLAQTAFQRQPFQEETVTDLEIGVKSGLEAFGAPVRINLAAYYMKYDDVQRSVLSRIPNTIQVQSVTLNAGKQELKGWELEVLALPVPDLSINLGLSSIDADIVNVADPDPVSKAAAEAQVTGGSPYMFNASTRYTLPLHQIGFEVDEVALQVDYAWEKGFGTSPVLSQAAYGVVNARLDFLGAFGGRWDVSLFMKNVADREYWIQALDLADTTGYRYAVYGAPRTWGVQLKGRFGAGG